MYLEEEAEKQNWRPRGRGEIGRIVEDAFAACDEQVLDSWRCPTKRYDAQVLREAAKWAEEWRLAVTHPEARRVGSAREHEQLLAARKEGK